MGDLRVFHTPQRRDHFRGALPGILLGAAEWLAVILATRTSAEDYQNLPNAVPAVVGEALVRWLAAATAAGCLIAFAGAYFVGRRVSANSPRTPAAQPQRVGR